jgi:drug/metabolite transporter (DMT)-like permease
VAFPAYYALIDRAGPVRANLVSYTVPPVATVASAVVLGEVVPPRVVVGFVLILVGFVLVERRNLRPRRASSPSIDRSGSEPTGSMRTTRKRGERSR